MFARTWPPAALRPDAMDWQSRTGRIVKYSRDRSHAYVIWNGNHTSDRVSVDLIEPCSFAPGDRVDNRIRD